MIFKHFQKLFLYKREIIIKSTIRYFRLVMFKLPEKSQEIFNNLWKEEHIQLINLFKENNYEIRIAGGAVRDILMNLQPHDIDFATNATPTEMKDMFIRHNIRLINANGESHGTITPRINDKENFEITTLRIDKVTDGRRASVEFTRDWSLDAERRDLTINSMFLDDEGVVYDYFGGKDDIEKRIVRFVGDPEKRIQEDYLRILRYFRFYGRIAEKPDGHLQGTIDIICKNRSELNNISGERVWMEMRKIISGRFAPEIIAKMKYCQLLEYLGLPADPCLAELEKRHPILERNCANPIVFLSTLFRSPVEFQSAYVRMKLSNDELVQALFMVRERDKLSQIAEDGHKSEEEILSYFQDRYLLHSGEPPLAKLKLCFHEYFKYIDRIDLWQQFSEWKPPKFPVRGDQLAAKWQIKGKRVGLALEFLKSKWSQSGYTAVNEELIDSESLRNEFLRCEIK